MKSHGYQVSYQIERAAAAVRFRAGSLGVTKPSYGRDWDNDVKTRPVGYQAERKDVVLMVLNPVIPKSLQESLSLIC